MSVDAMVTDSAGEADETTSKCGYRYIEDILEKLNRILSEVGCLFMDWRLAQTG